MSKRQYKRIQKAAEILEIAKNGSRETCIIYMGNLSFGLLQKYFDLLLNCGLLVVRGGSEEIHVSALRGSTWETAGSFRGIQTWSHPSHRLWRLASERRRSYLSRSIKKPWSLLVDIFDRKRLPKSGQGSSSLLVRSSATDFSTQIQPTGGSIDTRSGRSLRGVRHSHGQGR